MFKLNFLCQFMNVNRRYTREANNKVGHVTKFTSFNKEIVHQEVMNSVNLSVFSKGKVYLLCDVLYIRLFFSKIPATREFET